MPSDGHMITYTKWHMARRMQNDCDAPARKRRLSIASQRMTNAATRRQGDRVGDGRKENRARDRALLQVGPDATNAAIMLAGGMRNEEERRAREDAREQEREKRRAREQEREQEWRAREAMMPLWDAGKEEKRRARKQERELWRAGTEDARESRKRWRAEENQVLMARLTEAKVTLHDAGVILSESTSSAGEVAGVLGCALWDVKDTLERAGVYEDTCFDEITTALGQEGWLLGSSELLDQLVVHPPAVGLLFLGHLGTCA
jgi:hypothetical protein